MKSVVLVVVVAASSALMIGVAPARADDVERAGTTVLLRDFEGPGVTRLRDAEMAHMRGGADAVAFNAMFSSLVDPNAPPAQFATAPPPVVTAPGGSVAFVDGPPSGDVSVSTVIGEFRGANGIFQIAQVPGNNNIVNNNLFLQVAIINVTDSVPNLSDLLNSANATSF